MVGLVANKRGWVRIVEAVIAIMIITGFVLTYTAKKQQAENDLTFVMAPILEELAGDNYWRGVVLDSTDNGLKEERIANEFVGERITNPSLGYAVRVCSLDEICTLDSHPETAVGDVYAVERIISTTPDRALFEPKKVKLFLWRTT